MGHISKHWQYPGELGIDWKLLVIAKSLLWKSFKIGLRRFVRSNVVLSFIIIEYCTLADYACTCSQLCIFVVCVCIRIMTIHMRSCPSIAQSAYMDKATSSGSTNLSQLYSTKMPW